MKNQTETRTYTKHTYQDGLSVSEKRKQRRAFRAQRGQEQAPKTSQGDTPGAFRVRPPQPLNGK